MHPRDGAGIAGGEDGQVAGSGDLDPTEHRRGDVVQPVAPVLPAPSGADVALLNDWASRPGAVPQLVPGAPGRPYSRVRATSVDQVLADIARDAVDAIGNSPLRVRRCAAPTCRGVFLDDSPAATRHPPLVFDVHLRQPEQEGHPPPAEHGCAGSRRRW
ncbi:CGNR zinc finger domain-containing protein [Micromonospora sp. NBC_01699]|nr:CGNR zinc finger domain-containing protein [Micromonospora sp. NBC_01699]